LCAIKAPNPAKFQPTFTGDNEGKLFDKLRLDELDPVDRGGVVPGSVWSFSPQQKSMHRGDYHKVFNSNNFIAWWTDQLLPNLTQPSFIVMDNAGYHCKYPEDVPIGGRQKKADYVAYLQSRNVPIDNGDTLSILKAKAKAYIVAHEKMLAVKLAEERGHKVYFTPPHHSDLQPIELLWAKLKGNIGRKYNSHTTMTVLKNRLDKEFEDSMGWHESIEGMIRKTTYLTVKMHDDVTKEDEMEEPTIGISNELDQDAADEGKEEESSGSESDSSLVAV
jgi:transposase